MARKTGAPALAPGPPPLAPRSGGGGPGYHLQRQEDAQEAEARGTVTWSFPRHSLGEKFTEHLLSSGRLLSLFAQITRSKLGILHKKNKNKRLRLRC